MFLGIILSKLTYASYYVASNILGVCWSECYLQILQDELTIGVHMSNKEIKMINKKVLMLTI